MKSIKEFPFEKARRIDPLELRQARRAIEKVTGRKRKVRVGRPPKAGKERYVAVSIRLHPSILRMAKVQAKKKHIGYQTLINDILLGKLS